MRLDKQRIRLGCLIALGAAVSFSAAKTWSQDVGADSAGASAAESSSHKSNPAEEPAPNALQGLFVPQPQYPTPGTTIMFPDNVPKHLGDDSSQLGRQPGQAGQVYYSGFGQEKSQPSENTDNPLRGLFQQQPQYPTPGTTIMFPQAVPKHLGDDSKIPGRQPGQAGEIYQSGWGKDVPEASGNKDNVLKGLFQQQPQYPSPGKTIMFPEAVPQHLGDDASQPGRQPGSAGQLYVPQSPHYVIPDETIPPALKSAITGTLGGASPAGGAEAGSETGDGSGRTAQGEKNKAEKDKEKKEGEEANKEDKEKKEGEEANKEDKEKKEQEEKDKTEGEKGTEAKEKKEEEGSKEKKEEGTPDKAKQGDSDKSPESTPGSDKEQAEARGAEQAERDKEAKTKEPEKQVDGGDGSKAAAEAGGAKEPTKQEAYHPLKEAIWLMNSGKHQQSLDVLTRFVGRYPNSAQAYYTRAVLHVMMRQYAQAAQDYKKVLSIAPSGDLATRARTGLAKLHF